MDFDWDPDWIEVASFDPTGKTYRAKTQCQRREEVAWSAFGMGADLCSCSSGQLDGHQVERGGNALGVAHAMSGGCIRLREAVLYIPVLADIFGVVPLTTLVNQISTAMFQDRSIRSQED